MTRTDSDDALRDLGLIIAELRSGRGLTQEQLAEEARFTSQYLQRVEAGNENLTVRSLLRFAELFDVQITELFRPPQNRERRPGRPRRKPK